MLLLCAITYRYNKCVTLNGVLSDVKNIENLCSKLGIEFFLLLDDDVTLNKLEEMIIKLKPSCIWFCGLGLLNKNTGSNEYILNKNIKKWPFYYNKITDIEFGNLFKSIISWPILVIFDVCHSATFINLEYYFYINKFLKKIDSSQPIIKSEIQQLIVLSAATDFDTTSETIETISLLIGYFIMICEILNIIV